MKPKTDKSSSEILAEQEIQRLEENEAEIIRLKKQMKPKTDKQEQLREEIINLISGWIDNSNIQKHIINLFEKALSLQREEVRREVVEEIKQLANNLKVTINSNVDTRTMEYKAYLQWKGHNGALTLLHDSLDKLPLSSDGEKKGKA